jgi:GR25 family glycosyltransferase involved in LPS biosynthesis
MEINKFFTQCYVTNMSYRPDRLAQATEEIRKLELGFIREEGIIYTGTPNPQWNGWIGCGLCHYNILTKANRDQHILIFEDDFLLINDYKNTLESAIDELPEDWCMLHLGGNICRPIVRYSEHLGKTSHVQATHAYAVNKNFIPTLIEELTPVLETRIIDTFYADNIVPKYECYITIPMVAVQRDDYSDIDSKAVSYRSWMEQRYWDNLKG